MCLSFFLFFLLLVVDITKVLTDELHEHVFSFCLLEKAGGGGEVGLVDF